MSEPLPAGFTLDTQEQQPLPAGFTLDSTPAKSQPVKPDASEAKKELIKKDFETGNAYDAVIEPALKAASSIPATVAGAGASLYGLVTAPSGLKARTADDYAKATQSALTYEPRTKVGKLASEYSPLSLIGKGIDYASNQAADKTFETTGSEGLAAAAAVGVQGVAQILGGKALGGNSKPIAVANPEQAARAYVSSRTTLDFDALPAGIKGTLKDIAQDAKRLDSLDPKALERAARLQKLGIPATRGQVTRDLGQLTREENITKADVGKPVREINAAQDQRLYGLLDELRGKTGGQAETRGGLGKSVQGAERSKLASMKAKKTLSYKAAKESGSTLAPADITPLEVFMENPTNRRNAGYLQSAIKDYSKSGKVSINDLEEIRKEANAYVKKPGPEGYFAKQAVGVIDEILDNAGNDTYKKARFDNRELKQEFDRQGRIKKLVSEKGYSSDRAVALEDTFDTIIKGSAEDITKIKSSLLDTKRGSGKTRALGAQAWKDIQAATIDHLKERASGKRGIVGENDQLQFNSAFRDAFSELDKDGKIDVIFAPEQASMLRDIYQSVGDVRTKPSGRISGSDTVPRAAAMIESLLDKVAKLPIGDIARGAVKGVKSLKEKGRAAKEAQDATVSPLDEAARSAVKGKKQATRLDALKNYAPGLLLDQQQ